MMTAFFAYGTAQSIGAVQAGGTFQAAALRFRVLVRRGSGVNRSAPALAAFEPLLGDARSRSPKPAVQTALHSCGARTWRSSPRRVALGAEVKADCYFLVTGIGDLELNPNRRKLLAADAEGAAAGSCCAASGSVCLANRR